MSERCPCGDIILADTESWETPLCHECWVPFTRMDIRRLCKERDAYRETLEFIVAGPRFKRERLTVTDWAEAYEEASDAARDALDNFSKEKK